MALSHTSPAPARITRVVLSPAYEQVCAQVRRAVHLGEYVPGDRLPSERDLAKQLGVSRMTVREALRVLQAEGYVIATGRAGGGRLVVAPTGENAQWPLKTPGPWLHYLSERWGEIDSLFEFRLANECAAARLAATRRTAAQLRVLDESLEALRASDNIPRFRRADSTFHLCIAEASANPYFRRAIEEARADMFRPLDIVDIDVSVSSAVPHHTAILKAIRAKDAAAAERAMAAHIETARTEIRRVIKQGGRRR
ncbi:MAG TPA: FCD domain-containing protein [Alphaproteobacteria bacterium]|nr:FCD domain-containing protein [Alphaproteobacteria bacterium]